MKNNTHLILTQEIYQQKDHFNVEIKFCNHIIKNFPSLSSDSVRVISKSIVNKLLDGVEYPTQLETTIKIIYPVLLESLKEEHKTLSK